MAFERITLQVAEPKKSAGITITQDGKVVVAIHKDLVAQAGFTVADAFCAMLGTDDDAGKLRIVKDEAGIACARELVRTGAFFFRLGMVPAIGVTPHKQRQIDARLVDGGIEVDIPADEGPKLVPPPAKEQAAGDGREIFFNGVSIDLSDEGESITFDGESVAVSDIEAKLVMILARPRPAPVSEAFIIGNLWEKNPPKKPLDELRMLATGDLKKGLASIGLDLAVVKGVGYQLKDL